MKITDSKEWKGYTLDELRVRRLVTLSRIEIEKSKLTHTVNGLSHPAGSNGSSLMGKVLGAFSYVDYGIFAYKLMRRAFHVMKWIRKK